MVTTTLLAPTVQLELPTESTTITTRTTPHMPSIQLQWQSAQANAFMTEEQLLVDDVWKEVTKQYVDNTYNGLGEEGWKQERLKAIKAVGQLLDVDNEEDPDDKDGDDTKTLVYEQIRTMLAALHDPYTRFLTPEQYDSLTAYAKGTSIPGGIGVSLLVDPTSGNVVVANTSRDGPAKRAGIVAGDVVVSVDGMDVSQHATAELVAARCRGPIGSNVRVIVRRHDDKVKTLTLTRANIEVNPVEASTLSINNKQIGLLKVTAFNQETTSQIVNSLRKVRNGGSSTSTLSAIVIDLRGNAGGYMPAGVDVAKLFLPPKTKIITESDKSGRATTYVADGVGSETQVPLYVLVDKRTASAAEILTAALQDNHRATVVGGTETFGKGRIQNVQALEDGSGIAITKAKYTTPLGRDIHGVGITPDVKTMSCGPDDSPSACLADIMR